MFGLAFKMIGTVLSRPIIFGALGLGGAHVATSGKSTEYVVEQGTKATFGLVDSAKDGVVDVIEETGQEWADSIFGEDSMIGKFIKNNGLQTGGIALGSALALNEKTRGIGLLLIAASVAFIVAKTFMARKGQTSSAFNSAATDYTSADQKLTTDFTTTTSTTSQNTISFSNNEIEQSPVRTDVLKVGFDPDEMGVLPNLSEAQAERAGFVDPEFEELDFEDLDKS